MSEQKQENQTMKTPEMIEQTGGGKKNGTSGLAVAGLVVGIVAIIGSWVPILNVGSAFIAVVAIGLSIVGIIISTKGTKGGKGIAIAGLVLGIITIFLVIIMYSGAGSSSDNSSSNDSSGTSTQTEAAETKDDTAVDGEGDLGDYHIKIGKSKMTTNYDGKPAIVINYEFTNNSDDAISFDIALLDKAFQNGVELDSAYFSDEDESYFKDVKPGITFKVKRVYALDDESADVEVEVSKLISFSDDKITKTFSIK